MILRIFIICVIIEWLIIVDSLPCFYYNIVKGRSWEGDRNMIYIVMILMAVLEVLSMMVDLKTWKEENLQKLKMILGVGNYVFIILLVLLLFVEDGTGLKNFVLAGLFVCELLKIIRLMVLRKKEIE